MRTYHKFQSTETTSLATNHNKKRQDHELSKHQVLQHKKKSTNTTLVTYHTATGANTVCKEGADNNTIRKIDYAFVKSDNDRKNATVLTMCESTTGLERAMMVPYKGTDPDAVKGSKRSNAFYYGKLTTNNHLTIRWRTRNR
eukprot:5977986-Amphidinium_carterae.1